MQGAPILMSQSSKSKNKNFFVYMIYSERRNVTYVGYTSNISKRLNLHNLNKGAKFTRGNYWELIYSKKFKSRNLAMKYEYILKKNRITRKKLLDKHLLNKN